MKLKKSERTRKKIMDAFYLLNESGNLPTVNEICAFLDISVSTFYCHFTGVREILNLENERLQTKLLEMNEQLFPQQTYIMTRDKMQHIVTFAQNNRRENLLLLRPELKLPYREFLEKNVYESVTATLMNVAEPKRKYIACFIAKGIVEAINTWLMKQDISKDVFVDSLFVEVNAAIHADSCLKNARISGQT